MVNLCVVAVGTLKEKYLADAVREYVKRLSPYCKLTIVEIPETRLPLSPSPAEIKKVIADEGKNIIKKIPPGSYIFSLCIDGEMYSSEDFSSVISKITLSGKSRAAFIIGGSFGLSEDIKQISDTRLSMSKMTFPHQLTRVILLEQLYRAFSIIGGGKYHK